MKPAFVDSFSPHLLLSSRSSRYFNALIRSVFFSLQCLSRPLDWTHPFSLQSCEGSLCPTLLRLLWCSFYIVFTTLYWDKKIWKYWGSLLYWVSWSFFSHWFCLFCLFLFFFFVFFFSRWPYERRLRGEEREFGLLCRGVKRKYITGWWRRVIY